MEIALEQDLTTEGDVSLFLLGPEHVTEAYLSWMQDEDVQRFLESRFGTHTLDTLVEFVAAQRTAPNSLFLGISYRGKHIGNVKIGPIDGNHRTADLGFLIGETVLHGRGIGTASLRIALRIAERQLGLQKLTAGVYGANLASARAFEKAGFVLEGRRRAQFDFGGARTDHLLYGYLLGEVENLADG